MMICIWGLLTSNTQVHVQIAGAKVGERVVEMIKSYLYILNLLLVGDLGNDFNFFIFYIIYYNILYVRVNLLSLWLFHYLDSTIATPFYEQQSSL